jgi:hypothetical protein
MWRRVVRNTYTDISDEQVTYIRVTLAATELSENAEQFNQTTRRHFLEENNLFNLIVIRVKP